MAIEQPTTMDDLLGEFEFEVPGVELPKPVEGITIDMGIDSEKSENPEEVEDDVIKESAEEEDSKDNFKEISKEDEKELSELKKEASTASEYKTLALKYIEKGKWSADLGIEDSEGNIVPISELDNIDEDTFFQIEDAVKTQEEEEKKSKFISLEGVEERRKNIITLVKEGGDLTEIFNNPEQIEEYINPFSNFDLEDENVQARIYFNALVKHNNLDEDTAALVVNNAKKDLTLDVKVKTYIDQYTESFDKYVEVKKQEVIENKAKEIKEAKEFKKAVKEQIKAFEIKDTLANKLAESAVNKIDGEFEIDSLYSQKMENPEEAAELILFLTDKKAYLDYKLKNQKLEQHKKTRQIIKLIPKDTRGTNSEKDSGIKNTEFEFEVPVT